MTAAAKQVSQDPMDFVSIILYVRKGIPTCDQLVRAAAPHMDVLVQDVDALQCERPGWLRGVPTAVKIPDYTIHAGSKAIQVISEKCEEGVQGMGAEVTSAPSASSLNGATLSSSRRDATPPTFADLFTCDANQNDSRPPTAEDERYQDRPKEIRHTTTLEQMMRLRGTEVKEAKNECSV